jgi:hypothetical protein
MCLAVRLQVACTDFRSMWLVVELLLSLLVAGESVYAYWRISLPVASSCFILLIPHRTSQSYYYILSIIHQSMFEFLSNLATMTGACLGRVAADTTRRIELIDWLSETSANSLLHLLLSSSGQVLSVDAGKNVLLSRQGSTTNVACFPKKSSNCHGPSKKSLDDHILYSIYEKYHSRTRKMMIFEAARVVVVVTPYP